MFEITLKIRHLCSYLKMSQIFDGPTYSFCSEIYDLFIIPRKISHEEMEAARNQIDHPETLEVLSEGDLTGSTYLYFQCMCKLDSSISPRIENYGGLVQQPLMYEDGWEIYKVICLNEKTTKSVLEFVQTLDDYELVSIQDLGRDGIFKSQFISVHQMLGMVTDRQIEVLVEAYQQGYYEIPRNTTTQEIANSFSVSRPATEKSLRKAENSIMSMIIPYLIFHQRIHSITPQPINAVELF